eukprot:gene5485-3959_t
MSSPKSSEHSTDSEGVHAGNISEAVRMMWNNEYDGALEILKGKKHTQPRYALEWAAVFIVQSLMSSTNEGREKILDLLKEADTLAVATKYDAPMFFDDDDEVPGSPDSRACRDTKKKEFRAQMKAAKKSGEMFNQSWKLECDVIYADALLLRAICQLMMNSYLKGGMNLRKAWGCFYTLIQEVENDTTNSIPEELKMAIKCGTGTFYAFLALVPANLMKLLSIIGFISDKELGEKYLTEVFQSNSIRAPFAALVLCTLYLFLPTGLGDLNATLDKAKVVLETMNKRYPNNTYFHGYSNFYYRKRGQTEEAVKSITLAATNAEKVGLAPLLIRYLLADTLFMDLAWKDALSTYTAILHHLEKTKEKFAYTGQIVLSVAACHVMLGNKSEAMNWVKKVKGMYNPKSKNDSNSPKMANRIIANPRLLPLAAVYMLYINRDLAHMNKDQGNRIMIEFDRVLEGEDTSGPETENMIRLFRGVICKGCGRTDDAFKYLNEVFDHEKKIPSDSMILPFAYYEAAELEYRQGNLQKAKEMFEKGSKLKGDGNETLSNRYSIAMKQLKKKLKEEENSPLNLIPGGQLGGSNEGRRGQQQSRKRTAHPLNIPVKIYCKTEETHLRIKGLHCFLMPLQDTHIAGPQAIMNELGAGAHAGNAEDPQGEYQEWVGDGGVEVMEGAGVMGDDGLMYFQGEDGYWYAYDPNATEEQETRAENQADTAAAVEKPPDPTPGEPEATPPQNEVASAPEVHQSQAVGSPQSEEPLVPPPNNTISVVHFEAQQDSYGWVADIVTDMFFTRSFRVYLTVLLYCAAALVMSLNIEYTFALLLRLFSPPSPQKNSSVEAFGYLSMFLFYSFVAVSSMGVIADMGKQIWSQKRVHKSFWGMSNTIIWAEEPPCIIYFLVIVASLVLPALWGLIECITAKQSVVFMAQRFANVAVLAGVFLIAMCYVVFYGRAIVFKRKVSEEKLIRDDFELRAKAYKHEPQKMAKTHWYHASTELEEYGLDRDTLLYNSIVFIIGLTPLLGIYTAQTLCTFIGDPTVVWGLVSSVGVTCMIIVSWLTRLHVKGQWSAYVTILLIIALVVIGVVGAAVSAKPGSAGVVIVLFVVAQGMMTRKRKHLLTQREIQELMQTTKETFEIEPQKKPVWFDSYLCCCRSVAKDLLSCCGAAGVLFPSHHPQVAEAERRYARKRVALRTDHRLLLAWWLLCTVLVAFAVGLGNAVQYDLSTTFARTGETKIIGQDAFSPVCSLSFNTASSAPFSLVDLAFLSALSYTYGSNGDTDFSAWFGHRRNFYRVFPERLPPSRNYATDGMHIPFSDYLDLETEYHIITLNSNTRGLGVFRAIDEWGAVLGLQLAKALSPLISLWPDEYQEAFVRVSDVYHKFFSPYGNLENVTTYINTLIDNGHRDSILVVGDAFNGGYAKFVSAALGVPFVAFNPPGTKYTLSGDVVDGIQIISTRSIWSYIDSIDDSGVTYFTHCAGSMSMTKCSRIFTTIDYLTQTCGDEEGRYSTFSIEDTLYFTFFLFFLFQRLHGTSHTLPQRDQLSHWIRLGGKNFCLILSIPLTALHKPSLRGILFVSLWSTLSTFQYLLFFRFIFFFIYRLNHLITFAGHAFGSFTGTADQFVALNRVNILSVFRISDGFLADSVAHVRDFRFHCSIKYIHSVPILDLNSRQIIRHLLFLFSAKQEVSIVTFSSERETEGMKMHTLFYGDVNDLYQSHLHMVEHLSCSTSSCPRPIVTPFVAFGVSEGGVYFIDILSALGSQIQRKRCAHRSLLLRFFPANLVALMEERGKFDYLIKRPFDLSEYEVRCFAFSNGPTEDKLRLHVLFADQCGRVHVSIYMLDINPPAGKPAYSLSRWIACGGGEQQFIRCGYQQSNVDPTSSHLLVSKDGVIVVGSNLVSFIQEKGPQCVRSIELHFSGPTATEIASAALLFNGVDLIVCALTGACAIVHIDSERNDPWGSAGASLEIKSFCSDIGTLPSSVLPISSSVCLLPSSLEDTLVVELFTWNSCTVIDNCGPVIDMSVDGDGVTQMLLASTGAERRGGVSMLRSVMSLTSETRYQLPESVTAIHAAQELLMVATPGGVSFACYANGTIREVQIEPSVRFGSEIIGLYYQAEKYFCVYEYGVASLIWTDSHRKMLKCTESLHVERQILFSACGQLVMIAHTSSLSFINDMTILWSIDLECAVSSVTMDSSMCIVGQWDGSVSVIDLESRRIRVRMALNSVPHSICIVPTSLGDCTILIGLLNGYLCETNLLLLQQQRYRHHFFLMNKPVELRRLYNRNAVMCLGRIPMMVLVTNEGCEITGFSVDGVTSCGNLVSGGENKYVFHSRLRHTMHIGAMEDTQKLNRTFIPLGGTVTLVRSIPEWNGLVVALRRNNRESIVFLPYSTLQNSGSQANLAVVQQCELLENEQTSFLEFVSLTSRSQSGFLSKHDEEPVIFVGTGLLFGDEQRARSSRIRWFSQGTKGRLNHLGEMDIKGSLQSCGVVPHSNGMVALAVNGIISLYQWSPREQTFIQREQLSVGLMIFSLIPVTLPLRDANETTTNAILVAIDVRHGVFYIEINRDQGTMKVLSRDLHLREATAGAVLPNGMVVISDRSDNIYTMSNMEVTRAAPDPLQDSTKIYKLQSRGQLHMGQCINCMQRGSFAPAAVMNEYSQSLRLFRGLMGAQIVFGTAEGGFGTITPVGIPLYFVLRSIELGIAQVVKSNGGFQPEFYRELLVPGQERGPNRLAPKRVQTTEKSPYSRCRFVDGDVIEAFLLLQQTDRSEVLRAASSVAIRWWPYFDSLNTGAEQFQIFHFYLSPKKVCSIFFSTFGVYIDTMLLITTNLLQ